MATKTQSDTKKGAATKSRTPGRPQTDFRGAATMLKMVSDPTRLQVLMILSAGPRNVTELCGDIGGISQPAISHHLALLRAGKFIEPQRQGKNNVYELTGHGRQLIEAAKPLWEVPAAA